MPETPKRFDERSYEGEIFDVLSKLPDEYYVFHSFSILKRVGNAVLESEADFVIYHKDKGIICIEAKAGQVSYSNGSWYYGSGIRMKGDGPFNQASKNKWILKKYIDDIMPEATQRCKIHHAVWFPSITMQHINEIYLPPEADKSIIITREWCNNIQTIIDRIFSLDVAQIQTSLSKAEKDDLITRVLCPTFNLVPVKDLKRQLQNQKFVKLLKEQSVILNFLDEQRIAIINGIAGTGKTLIAIEKARREALNGRVLFLCFNNKLRKYLSGNYQNDNVDYYTIDGFACSFCKSAISNFDLLAQKLLEAQINGDFPYKHIVIDESQDFGQERIEESDIIEMLSEIIADRDEGTFYLFYDKLQLVQGEKMPRYIKDADCKLTLYKNCRNTKNIATTSLRPMCVTPKLFDGAVEGDTPLMTFVGKLPKDDLDNIIKRYINKGIKDIVILTCKTTNVSMFSDCVCDESYRYENINIPFYSCRKFKGLEAEVVILVDVDKNVLMESEKLFYVGASRARTALHILCNCGADDIDGILLNMVGIVSKKNKKRQLASALGCFLI